MPAFIAKQPNGLYCRHSTVVDCITHYNMTREDYINMCSNYQTKEEAEDVLNNYIKPFSEVKEYFFPNNMKRKEFNKILKEMESDNYNGMIET